jgi:hypothetical protein
MGIQNLPYSSNSIFDPSFYIPTKQTYIRSASVSSLIYRNQTTLKEKGQ